MMGFDVKNKDVINKRYLCGICLLILRNPVQLVCGHRQCKLCIESIVGEFVTCPECQKITPKKEMLFDRGHQMEMYQLAIACSLCDWNGYLREYEDHLQERHHNPVCDHCGKQFDSTNTLTLHKRNECEKITVPCVLSTYGCSDAIVRVKMQNHYMTEQHQKAIIALVAHMRSNSSEEHHDKDFAPSSDHDPNVQLREIYEIIHSFGGGIEVLEDDTQRLSSDSNWMNSTIDILSRDTSTLQLSVQEQRNFLDGIKINQEILTQDIASLKQKVEDMQTLSYDGTLVWKVNKFAEKMANARSERQTSIYSPPFYSSPVGYKMRARLYLHGDGNARRTHMSLFFVLMRGPNDAVLTFPFNYKVTFCMYDQTPAQRHIIDSFRPDIRSNSFQRPRSDMNIASGLPKFFPLAMIEQADNPYVRDDTMFIKIMVDFNNLPKRLLPYAFSLNPGLPTTVHQYLLKQEEERQNDPSVTAT